MQVFTDETEFTDVHMIQKVVGMFESRQLQRIVTCGLLGIEYDEDLDVDDYHNWPHQHSSFYGYQNNNRGLNRNQSRSSTSAYQPLNYPSSRDSPSLPFVKAHPKESDTERRARLLQEAKKNKEKAEKKRLKKQKQKQRKQMEKKKKQNKEGNVAEDRKSFDDPKENDPNSDVTKSAAAQDADSDDKSSEYESSEEEDDAKSDSGDSEELDLNSSFVSKAALIAKRKLEEKHKFDKEKKKSPEKEKSKSVPDKDEVAVKEAQKQNSAPANLTLEENIKISTDLAIMGNKFASAGDYNMAVKYFTDAIKYNPQEFKLFGNRSFCFEKLQEYEKALADAELCIGISPGWIKGLFRKGRALAGLKRYEEAAEAFKGVLKRDSSYAEAAQELMRVQIIQLMAYGFTREQSSNALIIHGTVKKALEVLSKLHHQPGAGLNGALPPPQVANVTGVSPVLSARTHTSAAAAAQLHKDVEKISLNKPSGPAQNIPSVNHSQVTKTKNGYNQSAPELFPVWVGNLTYPPTETTIAKLFSEVGLVYSVKVLSYKRCAFVNFTKQEHCDEAIRRFHGSILNGMRIAVRYPDRIPAGMGFSRSALRSHDQEDLRHYAEGRRAFEAKSVENPDQRGNK
ncbi:uncharacterized protein LOC106537110 [Austrofundulus limnaeus]|uniref:Uncharacterized protein LOC106537110 n=1 Tax=Austrofundulus limnaeus TaxID=52670 RepID=A0A2I4DCH2_AUSLI|nr:PREDICTED: uncharacterized protein LOC106537110 [Austrofundulus limnaeus]